MGDFSEDPVNEAIYGRRGLIGAIEILFENGCVIPGVMMIMCGIDTLSNLVRSNEKQNAPDDFKNWVRKYIHLPGDDCLTPDDIWSARNALLHTYGIDSNDVRAGKAKRVIWLQNPSIAVGFAPSIDPRSIRVDPFAFKDAFSRGARDFLVAALSNEDTRPIVEQRLKELITYSRFINEKLSRNAVASSVYEGASPKALDAVRERPQDSRASSKKRASGS